MATTPAGYAELLGWARRLGQPDAWGIEGTGSFGAGLARFLRGPSLTLSKPVTSRPGWRVGDGSRVVSLEGDPFGRDGVLPDLGLVEAGSGLEHGQGASYLRVVA